MSVNEKMTAIADTIRGYTERSDKLSLEGIATGISEVFGIGNQKGYSNGYNEGLSEGRIQGYNLGHSKGYAQGEEEGLEYTLNGLIEIAKIQETYFDEPMSFYILSIVTYETEKIECMTSDTWKDIVANDYNGIISQEGIYIDEYNNYVKTFSGSYLCGSDGSYCKSYEKPVPNMIYRVTAEEPIE